MNKLITGAVVVCLVIGFVFLKSQQYSETVEQVVTSELTIEFLEQQTGVDPKYSVIWLHGLGADGHDFEPIVPELGLPSDKPVRFIFPHAPMRPITINNGMVMRGWYDIYDVPLNMDESREQDRQGLEESAAIVRELIDQENNRGIPTENIILAGFSQGGAIALFAGLRLQQKLAGIIALSTYLPDHTTTETERAQANVATPIFIGHGTDDPIVPIRFGKLSEEILTGLGYAVSWHSYPMPHSVHPIEIRNIGEFIVSLLGD